MTHFLLVALPDSTVAQSLGLICSPPWLNASVVITFIICLTLFCLCWLTCYYIKQYKLEVLDKSMQANKKEIDKENDSLQKEKEKEKEKAGYRTRMLNFMEKRATTPELYNDDKVQNSKKIEYGEKYIEALKELSGMELPSTDSERPKTEGGA